MCTGFGTRVVFLLVFPFFLIYGEAFAQGDPKVGAELFKSMKCASCHGKDGKGEGPAAKAMKIKAADWTDKTAMAELSDEYLKDIITKGGKALNKSKRMPAYEKKLKSGDVEDLLGYIRSLAN